MKRSLSALAAAVATCLLSAGPLSAQSPDEVAELSWCAGDTSCLTWSAVPGALSYTVYRGASPDLPGLAGSAVDSCTLGSFGGTTSGSIVDAVPAPGTAHWFLVTAVNGSGEGSAGQGGGAERVLDSSGDCAAAAGGLMLNEADYDQPGTDSAEFVEIYNGGSSSRDLDGVVLILVNGLTGAEYRRATLSDAGPSLAAGAYLVVGSPSVVAALPPGTPAVAFAASTNNMQNGAPEGIALFDTATSTLLDALSYEGAITAAQFDGVPGSFNLVEGIAATAADSGSSPGSLARVPDGTDTDDADADWSFVDTPSPGAPNPQP